MLELMPEKESALKALEWKLFSHIIFFQFVFILFLFSGMLEFPFELTKAKGWRTFVEREHSTHHTVSVWSISTRSSFQAYDRGVFSWRLNVLSLRSEFLPRVYMKPCLKY
jgi:hypothetical protein